MKYAIHQALLEVEWTAQHGCGRQTETPGPVTNEVRNTPSTATTKGLLESASNVHCEMVIEMLCTATADPTQQYKSTRLKQVVAVPREGIPNSNNDAATNRANTNDPGQADSTNTNNARFGIHETPEYYNECNRVKRNRNLFTADQNVNRRSAIGTRQNPNGGRRGLECPEERDYFPYWRPSPFIPVAYLVDDAARCGGTVPCGGTGGTCGATNPNAKIGQGDWVGNAQGFKATGGDISQHGSCVLKSTGRIPKTNNGLSNTKAADNSRSARDLYNRREWPSNQDDCKKIADVANSNIEWKTMLFHADFDATKQSQITTLAQKGPVCDVIDWSRANHLGNSGAADTASRFTMKIPNVNENTRRSSPAAGTLLPGEPCLLRLRYNMSSSDYIRGLNSSNNGDASPIQQEPLVQVGTGNDELVQLALNTNQVARTFQDRSYIFYVKPRTAAGKVLNVNVRGKRGNIVQTYPAVEYDVIPNRIIAEAGTVLDFQWLGSDYNPRRGCNDGEGGPYLGNTNVETALRNNANTQGSNQNSRTDRMTLLFMADAQKNYPTGTMEVGPTKFFENRNMAMRFATANAVEQLAALGRKCLTPKEIDGINNENRKENHPRNCAEGNAPKPYFKSSQITLKSGWENQPPKMLFSARNNNFSNRDSKMYIWTLAQGSEG